MRVLLLLLQPERKDSVLSVTETFTLHSRPGATRKILLDFDGHTTEGVGWNVRNSRPSIVTPPYDKVSLAIHVWSGLLLHVQCDTIVMPRCVTHNCV